MSSLPPPPFPGPKGTSKFIPPPIVGDVSRTSLTKPVVRPEDVEKATPLPLVVASIALVSSLLLIILFHHRPVWVHMMGYFLTPFLVIWCTGLDAVWQRKRTTTDPWFVAVGKYSFFLRVLSAVSILFAYPHINGLANYLAAQLAKLL